MNPEDPEAEWFHLHYAHYCGNCEVIYTRTSNVGQCPHCASRSTVPLTRWIKPLAEATK
jgi:hypothetical protein